MTITKISGAVTPIAEADKINEIIDNMAAGVVWGSITGTMSNQTDLQTALNAAVHKTGNETIAGIKTFEGNNIIKNTYPFVEISNENLTKGTNPASMQYAGLLFEDKNADGQIATRLGDLVLSVDSSGNVKNAFKAWKYNGTQTAQISVIYPISGDPYATAPTPTEDTTASTQIDTVGARNTKLQSFALDNAVVHKSGNENIAGIKTFGNISVFKADTNYTKSGTAADLTQQATTTENWFGPRYVDANNVQGGLYQYMRTSSGDAECNMQVKALSTNSFSKLALIQKPDGTSYATLSSTPATSDNSTKISTTAYVNNKHQVVSTLPVSADADVYYYIPE